MVKRREQPVFPAAPQRPVVRRVGLDIGYGATKLVADDGTTIVFPSVCGPARRLKFQAEQISAKHPGDIIVDDEGEWYVGELAQSQVPGDQQLMLRGRSNEPDLFDLPFKARMARVALGKLLSGHYQNGDVVHLEIGTGLPVDHMQDTEQLKSMLKTQHHIRTNATDLVVNVTDVSVMPQPYGSIYSQTLLPNGEVNPHYEPTRTGVGDMGTYTFDVALDDDGEYIDAQSGSIEVGVSVAQETIRNMLEEYYRQKLPLKTVEGVLRTGIFRGFGEPVDYREEVAEALEPVRKAALNLLTRKWPNSATIDAIFITGGGGPLIFDLVKQAFRQAELVPESQFANARGYLNYMHFKARENR